MWELVVKGGPLMFLIILCSIIALAIVIERLWHLRRAQIDTEGFITGLKQVYIFYTTKA